MAKKEGTVLLSFYLRTVWDATESIHTNWPPTNEVLITFLIYFL